LQVTDRPATFASLSTCTLNLGLSLEDHDASMQAGSLTSLMLDLSLLPCALDRVFLVVEDGGDLRGDV